MEMAIHARLKKISTRLASFYLKLSLPAANPQGSKVCDLRANPHIGEGMSQDEDHKKVKAPGLQGPSCSTVNPVR
jgi:hypothetical protein